MTGARGVTVPWVVRRAAPEDVPAIARIHVTTWREAYRGHMPDALLAGLDEARRANQWREWLTRAENVVLVAERDAQAVGFCLLRPARDGARGTQEVAALYVAPTHWRSGAGTALLGAAIEIARRQRSRVLTLWVVESNARARRFYERRGLAADGARQALDKAGFLLHEVRYRMDLAAGTLDPP